MDSNHAQTEGYEVDGQIPTRVSVLVVERDAAGRELASAVLRAKGYDVSCVRTGAEAESLLLESGLVVDVVFTALRSSGLEDIDFVFRMVRFRPDLGMILTCDHVDGFVEGLLSVENDHLEVINRPFSSDTLLRTVGRLLELRVLNTSSMADDPTQSGVFLSSRGQTEAASLVSELSASVAESA